MSTAKKIIAATSGVGGGGLNVEDVYSTFAYAGDNSTSRDISNGIDLSNEGGMVWFKERTGSQDHTLFDTERGTKRLNPNNNSTEFNDPDGLRAYNNDGFQISNGGDVNASGDDYVSWTFRKAPKFFDIVTYTGNGTAGRQIAHNLGTTVGCLIVKNTINSGGDQAWRVFHRGRSGEQGRLNETTSFSAEVGVFGNGTSAIDPTSSVFTVGADSAVNGNNRSYVAYLFAHNDGDGGFGETGDQDIIKCGSYTGTGGTSTNGLPFLSVDIGFEAQWMLVRLADESEDWTIYDNITGGMVAAGVDAYYLQPNRNNPASYSPNRAIVTPNGFRSTTNDARTNKANGKYIYIAIRRGPMKALENATDVFSIESYTGTGSAGNRSTNILVDAIISARPTTVNNKYALDRIRAGAQWLRTETTEAEGTQSTGLGTFGNNFLEMLGNGATINSSSFDYVNYLLRRSPEFFDIVAYTGDGTTAQTITHNLNGVPKMIWGKRRDSSGNWMVYYGSTLYAVFLNSDTNFTGISPFQNIPHNYQPLSSDSQFAVGLASGGNADKSMNTSGAEYILYIFGEQTGISKIGTYSGTGSNVDVDCGFSSGARFVMIKNVTSGVSGNWNFMDTTKGIDDYMKFNSTDAEATLDLIDIINSGFRVKTGGGSETNASGNTYFFYAIA
jgi:hypothetical protein